MTKPLKLTLITLGVLVCLVGLVAFLLSRVDTKSHIEVMVSELTGLDVDVDGDVSIRLLPIPHVTLHQINLRNQQVRIASVGTAEVGVAFWPLLHRQVFITKLALQGITLTIERKPDGRFNFTRAGSVKRLIPATNLGRVSLTQTTFRYTNRQTDKELQATDCTLDGENVQLAEGYGADIMKHLALVARVKCAEVNNDAFVGTEVNFAATGEHGRFTLTPVTMHVLGGVGTGNIDADFSAALPAYQVHYHVTQMQVNDLFKSFAPGKAGNGLLNFTADLSMQGFNADDMTRTTQGEASLDGENIELAIGNLDEKLAHYESSQNFSLIDVGAFLVAGPLGTAVTKGYNFASIFQGAEGSTHLRKLASHWHVENGIAHAQDVGMATQKNRLVMQGSLDFVKREFVDVTVAFVDNHGCALVEQKITGPFNKPEVRKPNVLVSLTGPVANLIGKAKKIVGVKCDVFYEGSIAPAD